MGAGPTGQFFIPTLGIGVAQAMHFRQPPVGGLALPPHPGSVAAVAAVSA